MGIFSTFGISEYVENSPDTFLVAITLHWLACWICIPIKLIIDSRSFTWTSILFMHPSLLPNLRKNPAIDLSIPSSGNISAFQSLIEILKYSRFGSSFLRYGSKNKQIKKLQFSQKNKQSLYFWLEKWWFISLLLVFPVRSWLPKTFFSFRPHCQRLISTARQLLSTKYIY